MTRFFFLSVVFLFCSSLHAAELFFDSNNQRARNDAEFFFTEGQISDSIFRNGNAAILLSKDSPFALTLELKAVSKNERYSISAWRHRSNRTPNLIVTASWDNYYQVALSIEERVGEWEKLAWQITVPEHIDSASIKTYLFGYYGSPGYVSDLQIEKSSLSDEPMPLYMLAPLFFDLTNHYLIKTKKPLRLETLAELEEIEIPEKIWENYTSNYLSFKRSVTHYQNTLGNTQLEFELRNRRTALGNSLTKSPFVTEMDTGSCDAYFDKIFYFKTDTAILHLLQPKANKSALVYELQDNYKEVLAHEISLEKAASQSIDLSQFDPGFYRIEIRSGENSKSLPLVVQENQAGSIAILAPVTTWHAYNAYGGKSFYRNAIDLEPVHTLSTRRPMRAVDFDSTFGGHDLYVLRNMYNWFNKNYRAVIFPDYILEKSPAVLKEFSSIVLAQHCEYFSAGMYRNLENLSQTRNLLSLGGNQIYWKIRWNDDFSQVECRKDRSFFEGSLIPGMHWRDQWHGEAALLGVGYTHAGIGTYASFQVEEPEHWLFENGLKKQTIFGNQGIDQRGLSGDETDEMQSYSPKNTVLLATGTNANDGGGQMVFIERGDRATYSCGAISCGSGLGKDPTFSQLILNFLERYN